MTTTITKEYAIEKGFLTHEELMKYDPGFLERRAAIAPDLEPTFDLEAGTINSRFEINIVLYEVDNDGEVLYGRLYKFEKSNVNVGLLDLERNLVGIIVQKRRVAGSEFGQPTMGFTLEKGVGDAYAKFESAIDAALRESDEEGGIKASAIRSITPLGEVMVNPTSVPSVSTIFVLDCDSSLASDQLDFAEGIREAFWITPEELDKRILAGTHDGIRYDHGPLLWTSMKVNAWLRSRTAD